jgi:hypothetical protein
MAERRFLVVRLGSLGDIVHTFPAVAALRESFPAPEIIWLTHARYKLLVRSSGLASTIWTTETRATSSVIKAIREIRAASFDTSIDYQGRFSRALGAASAFPQNPSENLACHFFTPIVSTPPARTSPTKTGNCPSVPARKTPLQTSGWICRLRSTKNFLRIWAATL